MIGAPGKQLPGAAITGRSHAARPCGAGPEFGSADPIRRCWAAPQSTHTARMLESQRLPGAAITGRSHAARPCGAGPEFGSADPIRRWLGCSAEHPHTARMLESQRLPGAAITGRSHSARPCGAGPEFGSADPIRRCWGAPLSTHTQPVRSNHHNWYWKPAQSIRYVFTCGCVKPPAQWQPIREQLRSRSKLRTT
jgi:hypothetical protein